MSVGKRGRRRLAMLYWECWMVVVMVVSITFGREGELRRARRQSRHIERPCQLKDTEHEGSG